MINIRPAAFRRLCVETTLQVLITGQLEPAAFRRLCVETSKQRNHALDNDPAAFRRLCVETETLHRAEDAAKDQPPSGGCVLKR